MWRIVLIAILLMACPASALAQVGTGDWQACRGEAGSEGPLLQDCRPLEGVIDPQGRDLWLRSIVQRPDGEAGSALYIVGAASSEVWLNGQRLGANGQPGRTPKTESVGRYEAALPIPERMWRPGDNLLVVHMSSFHGAVRLDAPIAGIRVAPWPSPDRTRLLAIVFVVAGALFAAAFGFGVIHSLRRTGSSLTLAALSAVSGLQVLVESLRTLVPYAYPVHGWRLVGIWGLTAAFAILLVAYVASHFWPQARRALMGLAVVVVGATVMAKGFDLKTGLALVTGLGLSAVVAGVGVYRRRTGARPTLAYLMLFISIGALFPTWLVDLSYFLFAAGFLLPLLMVEVVRLGRDDRQREGALIQAVARPDCLTVVSSKRVVRVPVADIIAVVGADDYAELRLTDGRHLLHAARLDGLERELPPCFFRVHRSAIANLTHISCLERDGGRHRLCMRDGLTVPVSRNRLATVRDAVEHFTVSTKSDANERK